MGKIVCTDWCDAHHALWPCRWIEDTWAESRPDGTPIEAHNLLLALSQLEAMCLSFISGDTGQYWAVGKDASSSQISGFLDACYMVGKGIASSLTSANASADAGNATDVFLGGERPCLTDLLLWPFFNRALLCLRAFYPADALSSSASYNTETFKSFQMWVDCMKKLPATQLSAVDEDALVEAWRRTGRLDWFDYESVTVGQLHSHLQVQ